MLTDWELWACASKFIEVHGADASFVVALRADEFLAEGDFDGVKNFTSILRKIEQLTASQPDRLH